MTVLAGEKLGLFARTGQLSLKASEGPVEMQAQNASLRLFAEQKLTLSSASDIRLPGKTHHADWGRKLPAAGGGKGRVWYDGDVYAEGEADDGGGGFRHAVKDARTGTSHIYSAIYQLRDEQGNLLAGKPYKLTIPSGQTATGYTDEEGKTVPVYTRTQENVELHVVQKNRSRRKHCGLSVTAQSSKWKLNSGSSHNGTNGFTHIA